MPRRKVDEPTPVVGGHSYLPKTLVARGVVRNDDSSFVHADADAAGRSCGTRPLFNVSRLVGEHPVPSMWYPALWIQKVCTSMTGS